MNESAYKGPRDPINAPCNQIPPPSLDQDLAQAFQTGSDFEPASKEETALEHKLAAIIRRYSWKHGVMGSREVVAEKHNEALINACWEVHMLGKQRTRKPVSESESDSIPHPAEDPA